MENDISKNVAPLLKRTYMFLEDGDFEKAIEYCERILDIDPENAEAYLGKLMAEMKVCRLEDLQNLPELFNNSSDFQKVMRFADNDLKNKLNGYLQQITERKEYERKEALFNSACEEQCKDTISSLEKAIEIFSSIIEWNNAEVRIAACKKRIAEINSEKEEKRKKAEKQAELDRIALAKQKQRNKKICAIISAILCVGIVTAIVFTTVIVPSNKYNKAMDLYKSGQYKDAIYILTELSDYKDSLEKLVQIKYDYALKLYNDCDYEKAYDIFKELGEYKDCATKVADTEKALYMVAKNSIENGKYYDAYNLFLKYMNSKLFKDYYIKFNRQLYNTISASSSQTVAIRNNGTVVATGRNKYGECNVGNWENIVAVSASISHTVGLKADGTVVATGDNDNGQCNVNDWKDIVAISASYDVTIGLKSNGTVVATGRNTYGACDVSGWSDIIAICSDDGDGTIGLKANGTVVIAGYDGISRGDMSVILTWKDIIAISADMNCIYGLKKDGTIVSNEGNSWSDIVAFSGGRSNASGMIAIKSNGNIISAGTNNHINKINVNGWKNMVSISAGSSHVVAVKSDGTVIASGYNPDGRCNVAGWKGIRIKAD